MATNKATASKAKNTKAAPPEKGAAATAADNKAAASVVQVSCTVKKHGAKIRSMICAAGKRLTLPADEVEVLAKHGVVEIG